VRALGWIALLAAVGCPGCLLLSTHSGPWPCESADDCEESEKCVRSGSERVCQATDACELAGAPCVAPQSCTSWGTCSY